MFLIMMLIAVLWELPLATAPATMCLGRALFNQPLEARQIAREFVQSLPQLIFYQVLLRGLLLATVAGSFVPFVANPYLNEVILLERNPLRAARQEIDIDRAAEFDAASRPGRRFLRPLDSQHGDRPGPGRRRSGDRWPRRRAGLLNEQDWTGPFYTCLYPAALWIVVAYFTVVRFLGYLDLRIRREGWEVELLMRAELDRWTRMPQAS